MKLVHRLTATVLIVAVTSMTSGALSAGPPGAGQAPNLVVAAVTKPSAPRTLSATPGNGSVKLVWVAPASNGGATIDRYAVQRSASAAGPWTNIALPTATTYTVMGLTNGTRYYFRTRAHNSAGWGPPSAVVSAVPRTVPSAPRSLVATPGNRIVQLVWVAPLSSGGGAIDHYAVQRATNSAGPWTTIGLPVARSFIATELTNGTRYYFRIRAHNAAGYGPASTVVSAVPIGPPTAMDSQT